MACPIGPLVTFCNGFLYGKRLENLFDHLDNCEECSMTLQLLVWWIANRERVRVDS